MRRPNLSSLLRDESGIALIMALGFLIVLGVTGTSLYVYTSTNARSAAYSKGSDVSSRLAEAGINEALAVLANPANNAFDPAAGMYLDLPFPSQASPRTSTYATGTVIWYGSFNSSTATWTVTSTGSARNPVGGTPIRRTLTAQATVTTPPAQPVESSAWNYLYSWGTGNTCDVSLSQSVGAQAPMYVAGNLCLTNTATIAQGPLTVGGLLSLAQSANSVGTNSKPISAAHLGAGCKYLNKPIDNPCKGSLDNVHATTLDSTITPIPPPTIEWDKWYRNASPGPRFPCTTSSGTPPTFDNDTARNLSVGSVQNLTPASSYTCQTLAGQISWNASTSTMTISGTIFIDGDISFDGSGVDTYTGQGTIYASGTILMKNEKFCAVAGGGKCDVNSWDPNTRMLTLVANGSGGQVPAGDGIQLKNAYFQGALYATNAVELDTNSENQGPIVAASYSLGQKVNASWPAITQAQPGIPGNTPLYSVVTVSNYSG
jgi:hypothetical protein